MSLINKEICDFNLNYYQDKQFKQVKKEDLLGKCSEPNFLDIIYI